MNKPIQSYYLIKEMIDSGKTINKQSLEEKRIFHYWTAIKALKNLGFLNKPRRDIFVLRNLSHIELMAYSDEFFKLVDEKKNYLKTMRKEKKQEKIMKEVFGKEPIENEIDNYELLKHFPVGGIEKYSDEEILTELKKRGYEGELFIVKKQKINL